ncbi:hypothetical protein JMN32_16265 [Fulvivirga sp. 29W222]|uniref:Uncharacterized protein n=1 Tax=Fulvivirga marina TaxID=2494733 RepID=A0A937G0G8_9BACT|nr:hypothetical protein [Fulvivirga marina]MBL6447876.1 hypothetical protein [Fulvivirga marina]
MLFVTVFFGCEDEDAQRIPDFEEGVNVRFTFPDPALTLFNFDDLTTAKIRYNVYSESLDNITSVSLQYQYYDSEEDSTYTKREIRSYTPASFGDGQIIGEEITASELVSNLGLTLDSLSGGDQFLFFNYITDIKGRVYPDTVFTYDDTDYLNVTPNVLNASATTSFTTSFSALVGCPVVAPFTGTYELVPVSGQADPFNQDDYIFSPGDVTVTSTGPIFRTFNFKYYSGATYDFEVTFNFTLLCGNTVVPTTFTGIGCGGGITFGWEGLGTSTFDPNDDSELLIEINENLSSACGIPGPEPLTFKLVKK